MLTQRIAQRAQVRGLLVDLARRLGRALIELLTQSVLGAAGDLLRLLLGLPGEVLSLLLCLLNCSRKVLCCLAAARL